MFEIYTIRGGFVATVHTLGEAMFVVRHRATLGMQCGAWFGNHQVYRAY